MTPSNGSINPLNEIAQILVDGYLRLHSRNEWNISALPNNASNPGRNNAENSSGIVPEFTIAHTPETLSTKNSPISPIAPLKRENADD